ncbi:MAG: acyl-CoA dehydrogenase family protein [SAR86 cluster bacterium]|nr:acyl-CoA dehydrogenase family protein [SAR86 cluster bacterium]
MDFTYSEEQTLIQDQVESFITKDYDWETRQKILSLDEGFSQDNWNTFGELGWLGLSISEKSGGFGGSAIDTMIIMEQFGKGLVLEPYLETIVLGAGLLDSIGSNEQQKEILEKAITGKVQLATAFAEPQSRFNLSDVTTTAAKEDKGFTLNGYKCVVMNGPSADYFIVSARTSGGQTEPNGISLFIVNKDLPGLSQRSYSTVDGKKASELTLENVKIDNSSLLGELDKGLNPLSSAIDVATLAICAEAVGAMEILYKDTVEYTKTRKQFGQPIGKFQVLQHRMVDMFMEYEQSKSLLYMCAMKLAESAKDSSKAISGLKYQIGKASRLVGQQAVQLHGGMGVTDELNIGHYFKRLTTINTIFGNADFHLKRYSEL